MSREVRHDGTGAFQIRFPYDPRLVDLIKSLPTRRWNASDRFWWVPEQDVVLLVDLLQPVNFRFDTTTRELYRDLGGTVPLEDCEPAAPRPSRLPGLFDDEAPEDDGAASPARAEDYSVSRLNLEVKQAIEAAFPGQVWLVGEISGFNRNAHKRHVSFQLAEHDESGKTVSSVDATLFDRTRKTIERELKQAGEPFCLEDEVQVRVSVRVDLYVPWGSYRVVVEQLNVNYTLGEAARRREEIIRRLTEQGLVGLNPSLALAAVPLRVGLITSLGSDAYNDVLRTLQESGFAFALTAHGARVQGRATEPSVLNALDAFRECAGSLDVVLICRGGGSRTDLAWFDSEALGRAVARFPLPVVVGIGHEQDHSVLDAVARRCKTPTAAAAFLVETVRQSLERLESAGASVLESAAARLADEERAGAERGRRLALAARGLLQREHVELGHRRSRMYRGARSLLAAAAERLSRWARDVPRATSIHLTRQHSFLENARRAISQGARRDIAASRTRLDESSRALGPRARRILAREDERVGNRRRRLKLLHPRSVMRRGYAILRLPDGPVVTGAEMAPTGTKLRAELARGALRLRSEGTDSQHGGE